MKTVFLLLSLLMITFNLHSQTEADILKKANEYIKNKKYLTAFKTLENYDAKNDKPEIVLLKEKIVLNYFVSSVMHTLFAIKDLLPNEDIMQLRGQQGKYEMFSFPVDSILSRLILKYPNNCPLIKGLADYYYEVHMKYPDGWFKSTEEIFNLMEKNYQLVISKKCADYQSFFVLGYISINMQKYKEGIPYFKKSIEINPKYASSYYNMAYAYLYLDDRNNALANAKIAMDLYEDKFYKADAAKMIAVIYDELKDEKNCIIYYEKSNEISPGNYYAVRPLLNLYVKTGNIKKDKTREEFFNIAPDNPTIYEDLIMIYSDNNKIDGLVTFFKDQLTKNASNNKISGSLNFYLGRIYHKSKQEKEAKEYFLKAKEYFSKVFNANHEVFGEIERILKEIN